jgi:hypothetical protein
MAKKPVGGERGLFLLSANLYSGYRSLYFKNAGIDSMKQ